ncbi:SCF E3 ubiquitin ligase complex F-box protein grrA-like [Aphidius gifuensis]|uniref:SCF E3 ubiquitin ligase complex F-box protein grrA-like n=1 Tax=Aphidius gifuensis TaxID=684658 RepID=UPI001CDC6D6F|nr:SCF E3 ubiquitin ligase complex F-box protein grrA-like [Aphidius gifuensis]
MGSSNSKSIKFYNESIKSVSKKHPLIDEDEWRNRVNFPWYNIHTINFNDFLNLSQKDVTFILSNCGGYLNKLILNDNCGSSIMSTVKKHCQNLEELEFNFRYINEDDFTDAFTKMRKLKCLIVKIDLPSDSKKEIPVDMTKILSSLQDNIIEILLLTNKKTIGANKCLHNLPQSLERFNNLCHLSLKEYKINNNDIMQISRIKSLIEVNFYFCKFEDDTFVLKLGNLEILNFESMTGIDNCLANISNESKYLRQLSIKNCKVSASVLKELSNIVHLEQLNVQNVQSVDDIFINSIVDKCRVLKYLDVSHCCNISCGALVEISNIKNLEYLDISKTENINDSVIIKIANCCEKLKHLLIESCSNVSHSALNELGKLNNLETLCLVDINNAGDEIFNNMSQLRVLKCNWCFNVTDIGIMKIIKNSPNLKTLMLCRTGITRQTLACAAKSTKKRINNIQLEVITDQKICEAYERLDHYLGPLISFKGLDLYSRN